MTKQALDKYKQIDSFIKDYMKWKNISKISDIDNEQMRHQIEIVREMIELLP